MGLKELEKRLEQEPENLGLRVMVAGAMRQAGKHAEANELYRSVAVAYRSQGRVQQAIAVCRAALADGPDEPRIRDLLAALTATTPVPLPLPPSPTPTPAPLTPGPPTRPAVVIPPMLPTRRSSIDDRGLPPGGSAAEWRRGSIDETPLPQPMPYHVHDPTRSLGRISLSELPTNEGSDTKPGGEPDMRPSVAGIASAARKISQTLAGVKSSEVDITAELDTRRTPRITAQQIARLSDPPPTVPVDRVEVEDDIVTPVPLETRDAEDELTNPRDHVVEKRRPVDSILFAPLPPDRRGLVLSRFYQRTVKKSGAVIRQGETGHPLVLVVTGRLEVRAERANGTMAMLEAIGEGEFVGETSLLARAPADANVVAASDAELLLLSPHDVFEIAGAFPVWWAHLKQVAERRAREHERRR